MEHGLWTSVFSSVFPPICPVLVCMGLTAAEKPLFLFFALGAVSMSSVFWLVLRGVSVVLSRPFCFILYFA